mgnify:CR=1 FL=1
MVWSFVYLIFVISLLCFCEMRIIPNFYNYGYFKSDRTLKKI